MLGIGCETRRDDDDISLTVLTHKKTIMLGVVLLLYVCASVGMCYTKCTVSTVYVSISLCMHSWYPYISI